ncbi:MAG: hypothetical protein Q7T81_03880 [Pseudolabrys sp.]|nr:hypothetical protein [Pseudolabrys sp.]
MRAWFALTVITAGLIGVSAAGAADIRIGGRSVAISSYAAAGLRAPQLLVYDSEPGVYTRAYWARPWQNRHYYPFTGKKPKVGRHENLRAARIAPKPADTFYREWSTISLYPPAPHVVASQPIEPLATLK